MRQGAVLEGSGSPKHASQATIEGPQEAMKRASMRAAYTGRRSTTVSIGASVSMWSWSLTAFPTASQTLRLASRAALKSMPMMRTESLSESFLQFVIERNGEASESGRMLLGENSLHERTQVQLDRLRDAEDWASGALDPRSTVSVPDGLSHIGDQGKHEAREIVRAFAPVDAREMEPLVEEIIENRQRGEREIEFLAGHVGDTIGKMAGERFPVVHRGTLSGVYPVENRSSGASRCGCRLIRPCSATEMLRRSHGA